MPHKFLGLLVTTALSVLVSSNASFAGKVYIGVSSADVSDASPSGFQSRYKIDLTNWDQLLGNGISVSGANIKTANVSNTLSVLSGTTFTYTVTNTVGSGITFSLTTPSSSYALNWSSSESLGGVTAQSVAYNAIHPYAQATFAGSSVQFSNSSFTLADPSIQTFGTLPTSGLANNSNPVIDSYIVYVNDDGTKGNLASIGWTFTSSVTINAPGNSKEGAKFELTGKTLNYSAPSPVVAVPETSTWVMGILAIGAIAIGGLRRRKQA